MESITIDKRLIPFLLQLLARQVWMDYDTEGDVLYLSFAMPQQATDSVIGAVPGDIDLFLVMSPDFLSNAYTGATRSVFDSATAERTLGATVFWMSSGAGT